MFPRLNEIIHRIPCPGVWHQTGPQAGCDNTQQLEARDRSTVCCLVGTVARSLALSLSPDTAANVNSSVAFSVGAEGYIQLSFQLPTGPERLGGKIIFFLLDENAGRMSSS